MQSTFTAPCGRSKPEHTEDLSHWSGFKPCTSSYLFGKYTQFYACVCRICAGLHHVCLCRCFVPHTQLLQDLSHPFLPHAARWPAVQLLGCQQWQTAESTRGCSCSRPCPTAGGVILLIHQQSAIKSLIYNVKWLKSGLPGDLTVLNLHTSLTFSTLVQRKYTTEKRREILYTVKRTTWPSGYCKAWCNSCHLCGLPWDKATISKLVTEKN